MLPLTGIFPLFKVSKKNSITNYERVARPKPTSYRDNSFISISFIKEEKNTDTSRLSRSGAMQITGLKI